MESFKYKGFYVEPSSNFGNYSVRRVGRGVIPKQLKGSFTSPYIIIHTIDRLNKDAKAERQG